MPTRKTAAALKRLLQTRLDALEDIQEDGDRVFAHDIEAHAPDEEDRNWT